MADFSDIRRVLVGVAERLQSQKTLNKFGLAMTRLISKRTLAGLDVEKKSFKPYSERYKRKRVALGLPLHPVDLTVDAVGGMLAGITHKIKDVGTVSLDIEGRTRSGKRMLLHRTLASYHDSEGVAKRGENIRHFWGIADDEFRLLADIAEIEVNEALADLTKEV